MSKSEGRSSGTRFERLEVAIARAAPELVPAICWIAGNCDSSRFSAIHPRPPLEELAAVLLLGGRRVREVLVSTAEGASIIHQLPDISRDDGVEVARARAAQRLGLGVESVLPVPERRRGR